MLEHTQQEITKSTLRIEYVVDNTETAKNIDLTKPIKTQIEAVKAWLEDDWNGCLPFQDNMEEVIHFDDKYDTSKFLFFDSIGYSDFPHPLVKFGCACNTDMLKVTVKESRIEKNKKILSGMLLNAIKLKAKCTKGVTSTRSISVYTSDLYSAVGLGALKNIDSELNKLVNMGVIPDQASLNAKVELIDDSKVSFPANVDSAMKDNTGYSYSDTKKENFDNLGLLSSDPSLSKWLVSVRSFLQMKLSWLKTFNLRDVKHYTTIDIINDQGSGRYDEKLEKQNNHLLIMACRYAAGLNPKLNSEMLLGKIIDHAYASAMFNVFCNTQRVVENLDLTLFDRNIDELHACIRNFKSSTDSRKLSYRFYLFSKDDIYGSATGSYVGVFGNKLEYLCDKLRESEVLTRDVLSAQLVILRQLAHVKFFNPYFLGLPEDPKISEILVDTFGADIPSWAKPSSLVPLVEKLYKLASSVSVDQFALYRETDAGVRLKRVMKS